MTIFPRVLGSLMLVFGLVTAAVANNEVEGPI